MHQENKLQIIEQINQFCPISDNTIQSLENYVLALTKYNEKYNLIGQSTVNDIWNRHILDSAQLLKYIPDKNLVTGDFGSGAGFPGMVLSILGIKEVHLIEKSFRKCEFLELAREFSSGKINIHQKSAEEIKDIKFDLITSRAFAPMTRLLSTIKPFTQENTLCLFLKGKNVDNELNLEKKTHRFNYTAHSSLTSEESKIILISQFLT
jgi:16S rRNA (guanine527-N7)-methyltransferase